MPAPAPLHVDDLGRLDYRAAWARQLALVDERKTGAGADRVLVVEHPHVFTLGRAQKAVANVLAPGEVEVIEIERGGDVTYHGPGQLVAYPILALGDGERDLHRFLRNLEEAVIRTCAGFGLATDRQPGATGVWCTDRAGARKKLCSIGIACRRWVTFHGLALNVATDLAYFQRINPCGFASSVMTSMAVELDRPLTVAERAASDRERLLQHRHGLGGAVQPQQRPGRAVQVGRHRGVIGAVGLFDGRAGAGAQPERVLGPSLQQRDVGQVAQQIDLARDRGLRLSEPERLLEAGPRGVEVAGGHPQPGPVADEREPRRRVAAARHQRLDQRLHRARLVELAQRDPDHEVQRDARARREVVVLDLTGPARGLGQLGAGGGVVV